MRIILSSKDLHKINLDKKGKIELYQQNLVLFHV